MRKVDSEVREDCHDKSGAVRAACKAGSAVNIRIADKLCGVLCDLASCRSGRLGRCLSALRAAVIHNRSAFSGNRGSVCHCLIIGVDSFQVCIVCFHCGCSCSLRLFFVCRMHGRVFCRQISLVQSVHLGFGYS